MSKRKEAPEILKDDLLAAKYPRDIVTDFAEEYSAQMQPAGITAKIHPEASTLAVKIDSRLLERYGATPQKIELLKNNVTAKHQILAINTASYNALALEERGSAFYSKHKGGKKQNYVLGLQSFINSIPESEESNSKEITKLISGMISSKESIYDFTPQHVKLINAVKQHSQIFSAFCTMQYKRGIFSPEAFKTTFEFCGGVVHHNEENYLLDVSKFDDEVLRLILSVQRYGVSSGSGKAILSETQTSFLKKLCSSTAGDFDRDLMKLVLGLHNPGRGLMSEESANIVFAHYSDDHLYDYKKFKKELKDYEQKHVERHCATGSYKKFDGISIENFISSLLVKERVDDLDSIDSDIFDALGSGEFDDHFGHSVSSSSKPSEAVQAKAVMPINLSNNTHHH